VKRSVSIAFRGFTTLLLGVSIAAAYQNLFSDDLAVRARAGELARTFAGCTDSADSAGAASQPRAGGRAASSCKVTSMRGSRGMIDEQIEYDIEARGPRSAQRAEELGGVSGRAPDADVAPKGAHIVVVCRRAYIVAGDYACVASRP
jgi:hypothetical protein